MTWGGGGWVGKFEGAGLAAVSRENVFRVSTMIFGDTFLREKSIFDVFFSPE